MAKPAGHGRPPVPVRPVGSAAANFQAVGVVASNMAHLTLKRQVSVSSRPSPYHLGAKQSIGIIGAG